MEPRPHLNMLRSSFYSAARAGESCDVTLVGGDGEVQVHKLILLAALPSLAPLLCSLCSHTEQVVLLLPGKSREALERARDNLYLFDDREDMKGLLGLLEEEQEREMEVAPDETATEDTDGRASEESTESVYEDLVEDLLSENDATLSLVFNCTYCKFVTSSKVVLDKHKSSKHTANSKSRKDKTEDTIKSVGFEQDVKEEQKAKNRFERSVSSPQLRMKSTKSLTSFKQSEAELFDDPGADFEIVFEESFVSDVFSPTNRVSDVSEDSGVRSFGDSEDPATEMNLPEELGESNQEEDSVTSMDGFGRLSPDLGLGVDVWKKSASPMVYTCYYCKYKSFTKIMLKKHKAEKHGQCSSPNKRRLTICNSKEAKLFTCDQCNFSTSWKQTLEMHLLNNHGTPKSKVASSAKKLLRRKSMFSSPLVKRTLSMRPQFKFSKAQSDANLVKSSVIPEISENSYSRNGEVYGSSVVFQCTRCDDKTFLGTSLQEHEKNVHSSLV